MLEEYDAGLLNDFGGGDVDWWWDYIRAELGRAYEHYQYQITAPQPAQQESISQRAHEVALRQLDHCKTYALELQERLVTYEGGALMVLNTPPAQQEPDKVLLSFYQATDYPSLVAAMEHHIGKLQAKRKEKNT